MPLLDTHTNDEAATRALAALAAAAQADPQLRERHAVEALLELARVGERELLVEGRDELLTRAERSLAAGVVLSTAVIGRYALHYENPHSRLLGFLLDPAEAHGARARLLARFLGLFKLKVDLDEADVTIAVDQDLPDAGRPDVLVAVNQGNGGIVLLVETKVHADEHGDQLGRYRAAAADRWPAHEQVLVFLTPGGRPPREESEAAHWRPLSFRRLRDELLAWANEEPLPEPTRWLLRSWAIEIDHAAVGAHDRADWHRALRELRELVVDGLDKMTPVSVLKQVAAHLHKLEVIQGLAHDVQAR